MGEEKALPGIRAVLLALIFPRFYDISVTRYQQKRNVYL
jgi:hypothetical protein